VPQNILPQNVRIQLRRYYRPWFKQADGTIDTDAYLAFYDEFIAETTTGQVAGIVLEPIQGWAGSIFPPDDFFRNYGGGVTHAGSS